MLGKQMMQMMEKWEEESHTHIAKLCLLKIDFKNQGIRSKGSNKRIVTVIHSGLENRKLCEIDEFYHRKHTGTSISDLDLVCATGVKPQTRLAIDTRGLWAVLPVQGQDADSLQPADLLGLSA